MDQLTSWLALGVLVVATVWDLRKRQVPNAFPLLLLVLALVATGYGWHAVGWLSLLIGLTVGLVIGLISFGLGMMGGGDVKLLGSLGALMGMQQFWPVLFW